VGIGGGYGLSDGGLWRRHSRGIRREGIWETTEVRSKRFGVCLRALRADGLRTADKMLRELWNETN